MVGFGLSGFKFLAIFLLALHCFLGFGSVAQLLPKAEVQALKAIATKLHIDFWNVSESSCGGGLNKTVVAKRIFSNVTCDCSQSNGTVCHIATIQLKGMNLSGTIPDEFANLPLLQELDFNRNYLNGSIPSSPSRLLLWASRPVRTEWVRADWSSSTCTRKISLDGEQWNDGLLATIREWVHMEVDRKAMPGDALPGPDFQEKITYKVGSKVICCLEGARIGIQYETSYAGEPCQLYHCVLESKSFLEKMTVSEHTIPFFLPIREAETDLLSSNSTKFIDHVGELLQAYVDRREQVHLVKELYGNQIGELYHSLPYHLIEFVLDDFDCKITVSQKYPDLLSVLPAEVKVLAWPLHQSKKLCMSRQGDLTSGGAPVPSHLSYAEDALRTMSLPEAFAEIVLNLPRALEQIFP